MNDEWRICGKPGCGFRYRPYTQLGRFPGCSPQHTFWIYRLEERRKRIKERSKCTPIPSV